jgi:hypothetical protein
MLAQLFQNLREHQIERKDLKSANLIFPREAIASFREFEEGLFVVNFDEGGQRLKLLLEKGYQDGIDGLENVRVESGRIKGIFLDKVTSNLTKRYEFTIDESAIKYKLLNPSAVANADFTELEFARTKLAGDTKKEKTCPKGTRCRFSCISKLKECSYVPSADEKGEITYLKQKLSKKDAPIAVIDRPAPKKTAIALKWQGAWNDAPEDLKKVLSIIDEPEEATENLFGCAYQTDGKIYMHEYKPNTDADAVWRHEYGHILDELIPTYLNISDKDFVTSPRSLATLKEGNEAFRNDENLLLKKNTKFRAECVKEFEKEYDNYKDRDSFFKYAPDGKVKKQDRAAIGAHIKLLKLEEEVNPLASRSAFQKIQNNPDFTFGDLYEEQKALLLDQKFKEQKLDKSIGYQLFKNMPDGFLRTTVGVKMLTAGNSPEAIASCTAYYLQSKGKSSPGVATDLIGSLTSNKIGYGHSDEYYKVNPIFKRNTESIANIVSLYGTGDENVNAALNELAPNGVKFMKGIFKEVIDAK